MAMYKFIGCEIIYREACFLAATLPQRVDVEFLQKGLHDLPTQDMAAQIQRAIDAVPNDRGYDAILLGYARCNDGLVGVAARGIPLVIPRAHDCITFFFGSRGAYRDYFDKTPGTYYMTSGWAERNISGRSAEDSYAAGMDRADYARPAYGMEGVMAKLGLADSYETMVEKYGQENADYIIESMGGWKTCYEKCLYLEMGVCAEEPFQKSAREWSRENGWSYECRKGDIGLLRRLFEGGWNDDFLVVPPGARIVAKQDESIMAAVEGI